MEKVCGREDIVREFRRVILSPLIIAGIIFLLFRVLENKSAWNKREREFRKPERERILNDVKRLTETYPDIKPPDEMGKSVKSLSAWSR
jgi:hypothetical protein